MSIAEDIKTYTEKMNSIFFSKHWVKVCNLERDIARHLQKFMRDRSYTLTFTSQDLRTFTIQMDKVLKAYNKKSTFMSLKERFNRYDIVPVDYLTETLISNAKDLALARKLQEVVGFLNRYCAILVLLEEGVEYAKEMKQREDDELLQKAILEALTEVR